MPIRGHYIKSWQTGNPSKVLPKYAPAGAGFDHLSWVFDHSSRGSCHLKEGEQRGRKFFWHKKMWTHCEFQRHNGDLSVKERREVWREKRKVRIFGKGKCKTHRQLCEFLARESVNSSPILARQWWRHFRLTHFRLSLSLSLSLSHRKYLTHYIGSASALPIIQREKDGSDVPLVALKLAMNFALSLPQICTLASPLVNGREFTLSIAKNVPFFETVPILLHKFRTLRCCVCQMAAWLGIQAPKQTIEFSATFFFFSSKNKSN